MTPSDPPRPPIVVARVTHSPRRRPPPSLLASDGGRVSLGWPRGCAGPAYEIRSNGHASTS